MSSSARKRKAVEEIAALLGVEATAGVGSREPGWLIDLAVARLGLDGLAGSTKVLRARTVIELSGREWDPDRGGDAAPSGGGLNTTALEKFRDALRELLNSDVTAPANDHADVPRDSSR